MLPNLCESDVNEARTAVGCISLEFYVQSKAADLVGYGYAFKVLTRSFLALILT